MTFKRGLALLSLLFLLSVTFSIYYSAFELIEVFALIIDDGAGDPKLLAGAVSFYVIQILLDVIISLPSVIALSIVILKCQLTGRWLRYALWIFSVAYMLVPPFASLLGFYLLFLGRRACPRVNKAAQSPATERS